MSLKPQQSSPGVILERCLGMPEGGPKAIPLSFDFSLGTEYAFDYTQMQQRGFMDMVQSAFVDNSANGATLEIVNAGTQQTLKFPANKQGYVTLLCPNPIKLSFVSTGGATASVILLNFPISNIIFP